MKTVQWTQHLQISCRRLTKNSMIFLCERRKNKLCWIQVISGTIITHSELIHWPSGFYILYQSQACSATDSMPDVQGADKSPGSLPWSSPPHIPGSHNHVSEPGASPFPYAGSNITGSGLHQQQSDGLPEKVSTIFAPLQRWVMGYWAELRPTRAKESGYCW